MGTLKLTNAPIFPGAESLNARSFYDSDSFGMVHFTIHPGGFIPQHNMPFEVCFFILHGKGTLVVNDNSHQLTTDSIAVCLPESRRNWRNPAPDEDLMILALKFKKNEERIGLNVQITKMSEQLPAKNPHKVDVRRVYESEYALSSVITMQPGEKLIRHITPVDVFFYVLEGTGIVEVGKEKETVSADTVIQSPKDIPHCWYNESDSVLRVLVVKVPKPTSNTQLL